MMKRKLSLTSAMHYVRLTYRGALLLWAVILWVRNPGFHRMTFTEGMHQFRGMFLAVWVVLAFEMCARFFPFPTESMGSQKQFARNFMPTRRAEPDLAVVNRGVGIALASWIVLNGVIGILHMMKILSDGALLLIALFYSVSDIICILFFCPFQTWMMKNRCCATCRIYNWDYLMMVTPLMMIRTFYTWSLSALAIGLFLRWEITARRRPERFAVETNAALKCANCTEKLCFHKKQLRSFWQKEFRTNGNSVAGDAGSVMEYNTEKN